MRIVAGVDGGGTRTRVALANLDGRLLGIGISGSSNYDSLPVEEVQAHISSAFRQALDNAKLSQKEIETVFMGIAGIVGESDRNTMVRLVHELDVIKVKNISVDHDIRISLAGGLAGEEGIALIAGTGSACYGRRSNGRAWKSGGWGHLLDDMGSAYDLVRQSLIAVVRAEDRRGESTLLTELMMGGLQIDDISEIMRRLYYEGFRGKGYPMSKEELASLAPLVIKAAESKDKIARQVIENGVQELVMMIQSVADSLDFPHNSVPIVITGGTVRKSGYIKELLYKEINKKIKGARIHEPEFPPVVGGVILALQMLNSDLDQEVTANLKNSMTPEFE